MNQASKPTSMLTDAFGTLVVRGLGIVLIFVSTTLTARILGPGEYGTYSAAMSLALLLATLAPMGCDRLLVRNLSTARCPEEAGRETAMAHLCTVIVAAVLLSGTLGSWLINVLVFDNVQWAQTSLLASLMFVPLTVTYLRQWAAIPLIGTRQAMMPQQMTLPLIFTSTILLFAATGWELTAVTTSVAYAGIMLIVWVGSLRTGPLLAVYQSAWKALADPSQFGIRRRMRDGLPFVSVAIGSVLTQSCMPLIIAATCGFEETAYFALAMPYAALAGMPLGVFNLSIIPRCARCFQSGNFAEANHIVRSAATATFVLAAFLSFIIWQLSPLLIGLLGKEYATVCRLFPPLLLACLVDCLTGPTTPVMQTMKMETTHTRTFFAYIPIQLGLVWWFGRVAGIEGAATAYLLARCLWNAVVLVRIHQKLGLIMLPYLRLSQAVHEWSATDDGLRNHRYPRPGLWMIAQAAQRPVEAAKAA